jgi:hypothetical protein
VSRHTRADGVLVTTGLFPGVRYGRGVRTGMPADTRGTPTILQAGLRAVRRRKESRV